MAGSTNGTTRASFDIDPRDLLCINTIRTLAMDAVQQANSGHPGTPMALAPVAYCLWQEFLCYDPLEPLWPNRDRFILSAGHASMLLYALLHLAGVRKVGRDGKVLDVPAVSLDNIKRFRQLDSPCAGHPEYMHPTGVETTTGPLGQGIGTSVGMAIAQRWLASYFGRPGFEDLFDFHIHALCSDGCIMEGVGSEAASMAGHLRLGNLTWIYDSNHITIEGNTNLAFSEDVGTRFLGYGWNVLHVSDANNLEMFRRAVATALKTKDRPTLIIVNSHIAWGAPNKQDTHSAHGEPLGEQEIRLTKKFYGWPEDAKFLIPDGVYERFRQGVGERGKQARQAWESKFQQYRSAHPDLAKQWDTMQRRELPEGWDRELPSFKADAKGTATRNSGGQVLNAIAKNVPWLMGGSADLAPSTKTIITAKEAGHFSPAGPGRNLHFGIREHGMAAILNGMALTKVRPYGATFLIFSDYAKAGIRLGALMDLPVIHIFTHDSIGLGEDGPTHQPIEQLAMLRATPNLIVVRPADANEVVEAWKVAMRQQHDPVALILTRQDVPTFDRGKYAPASGLARGAYVMADAPGGKPDVILIGTGSEVQLCVAAQEILAREGIQARVVSMPSWELFEMQDEAYRQSVLPAAVTARVSVEAGSTLGWSRYVGPTGVSIGMTTFGASAPYKDLMKHFGITTEHVVQAARDQVSAKR